MVGREQGDAINIEEPRLPKPIKIGWESAKANAVPTFVLWTFALSLVLSYYFIPPVAGYMGTVRTWQESFGWKAVVVSRLLFNGIVPGVFLLSVKSIRPHKPFATIFAQATFGCVLGLFCDAFFRLQSSWFGSAPELSTLVLKTLVDQFVWTVLVISPVNAVFFFWVARDFSFRRVRQEWPKHGVISELVLPNLIPNWFVGIPAIFATYAFPLDLQIHVNGLVSAFWMLLCLQIGARSAR